MVIATKTQAHRSAVMDSVLERRRVNCYILLAVVFVALFFIVIKLFAMQVFAGGFYREVSAQNGVRMVPIMAPRGLITDSHGSVIVKNRPSYSIYIVPYEISDLDSACVRLGAVLGQPADVIASKIKQGWQGRFRPIRLQRDVNFETVCYIEEHCLDFPGVTFQVEPTREYPSNNFGSHMCGYVAEVTEQDLSREDMTQYNLGDVIGKDGLEKQYESYLVIP